MGDGLHGFFCLTKRFTFCFLFLSFLLCREKGRDATKAVDGSRRSSGLVMANALLGSAEVMLVVEMILFAEGAVDQLMRL